MSWDKELVGQEIAWAGDCRSFFLKHYCHYSQLMSLHSLQPLSSCSFSEQLLYINKDINNQYFQNERSVSVNPAWYIGICKYPIVNIPIIFHFPKLTLHLAISEGLLFEVGLWLCNDWWGHSSWNTSYKEAGCNHIGSHFIKILILEIHIFCLLLILVVVTLCLEIVFPSDKKLITVSKSELTSCFLGSVILNKSNCKSYCMYECHESFNSV